MGQTGGGLNLWCDSSVREYRAENIYIRTPSHLRGVSSFLLTGSCRLRLPVETYTHIPDLYSVGQIRLWL